MKYLVNAFVGGFGRSIGRIFGFLFIFFLLYLLISKLDVDLSDFLHFPILNPIGGVIIK